MQRIPKARDPKTFPTQKDSPLQWAEYYHRVYHWAVIPLHRGTKRTHLTEWKPYQSRLPLAQEIKLWWTKWPDADIAVVCGQVSGGLMVLDIDSAVALKKIKAYGDLPPTPSVKTKDGWHFYFSGRLDKEQGEGEQPRIYSGKVLFDDCELKGEKNLIVVPPSANKEWRVTPNEGMRAPLPLWIIEILKQKNSHQQTGDSIDKQIVELMAQPKYWKEGQRDQLTMGLAGYMFKFDWPEALARQLLEKICSEAQDEEQPARLQVLKDTYQKGHKGEVISGKGVLQDYLLGPVLQQLEQLLREKRIPLTMREIDEIRRWTTGGQRPRLRPVWERNRRIGEKIIADLKEKGRFLQVEELDFFWFDSKNKRVVNIESTLMPMTLDKEYGINPSETLYNWVKAALQDEILQSGEKVQVFLHSYYKAAESLLYIYAGEGLVYRLDGDNIEEIDNGSDGVFFKEPAGFEPWQANFDEPVSVYKTLIQDISFDFGENVSLTESQQQTVLWIWLRSLFFAEILPTKPLLTLVGEINSGKSTALRRFLKLFLGNHGEVIELKDETSWAPAVTSNHLLVLDNVNKPVKWMAGALDQISTGIQIIIRKLWVTNQQIPVWPRCFVALNSIEAPFRETTTASRMIILKMKPRPQEIPQGDLEKAVLHNRAGLWADLLTRLNQDLELVKEEKVTPLPFRLQDFAVLLQKLLKEFPDGEAQTMDILTRLKTEQDWQVLQFSPVPELLEKWDFDPEVWYSTSQLFHEWRDLIDSQGLGTSFFKTVRGLSRHLADVAGALQVCYGVKKQRSLEKNRKIKWQFGKTKELIKKQGDAQMELSLNGKEENKPSGESLKSRMTK